jgi:effector-binding domain-containing protein
MTHGSIQVVEHGEEPAAVVCGHATTAELPAFLGGAFGEVMEQLGRQKIAVAGPPFARYLPVDGGFDVEAGFPTASAVSPSGRVVPSVLPGGTVATTQHRGDYGELGQSYSDIEKWVLDQGWVCTGAPWESYLDGPEVPEPRTQISFPCAPA